MAWHPAPEDSSGHAPLTLAGAGPSRLQVPVPAALAGQARGERACVPGGRCGERAGSEGPTADQGAGQSALRHGKVVAKPASREWWNAAATEAAAEATNKGQGKYTAAAPIFSATSMATAPARNKDEKKMAARRGAEQQPLPSLYGKEPQHVAEHWTKSKTTGWRPGRRQRPVQAPRAKSGPYTTSPRLPAHLAATQEEGQCQKSAWGRGNERAGTH